MKELLYQSDTIKIISFLTFFMVVLYLMGYYFKQYLIKANIIDKNDGLGSVESSLLGLFAFFLGFTFNMAANKHETRRVAVIQEANAIGTAILNADLYPDSTRNKFRKTLSKYINERIAYFENGPVSIDADVMDNTNIYFIDLWRLAISHSSNNDIASRQMIPALSAMTDAVTTRSAANEAKIPMAIYGILFILCLFSSFVVGFGTIGRMFTNVVGYIFIAMVTLSIYLIIDLDSSRSGFITSDQSNEKIRQLEQSLKK